MDIYGGSGMGSMPGFGTIGKMFGAMFGVYMVVMVLVMTVMIVSMWKLFKKAGEKPYAAIVPFWNTAVLFKISWGAWYYMFTMLIPCAGVIFMILTYIKLAKAFGKGTGFGIGLVFLNIIFMPMLAFGNAEYVGISGNDDDGNDTDSPYTPPESDGEYSDDESDDSADSGYESDNTGYDAIPHDDDIGSFMDDKPQISSAKRSGRQWKF